METEAFRRQARQAVQELLEQAHLQAGDILVVGCSSSEILGGTIGAYMIEDDRRRLQQLVRSNYHYAPSSDFICLGYKDVDICACGAAISYVDEFVKSL